MSKTHYVRYRDDGFWAYDVAQGVLLKYLADLAEARAAQPGLSWLKEAAHSWRIGAVLYGLHIEESWSAEQLALFKQLVLDACELLETRETISSAEIEAWPMIDDLRIFARGAKQVATAPVVEFGRAVVSLLDGSLPAPPAGTWWCFGVPEGRTTIRNREASYAEIPFQGAIMSVKKEASGRRSVQVEVEVPGTPEEVWQAIATGPGISSWFVPTEFEVQGGKPVAVTLTMGPGMESTSAVTAWEPPQKWAAQSDGWVPGMPPIAHEWSVEARGGGICIVRIVQSLFASTDDWDHQLESTGHGWPAFLRTLRLYLTHFRGQRSASMKWMAPVAGTEAKAWETLTAALGLKGVNVGQRWTAPAGVPALGGVAEYVTQSPYDALLRLDKPGPGVAAMGTINCGGQSMVALNFYLYGDQAAGTVARETPLWDAWIQKRFPMPAEPGKSK